MFFLLNGCATTISKCKYTDAQYALTDANKIEVYQTSLPKKEYIELAEIRLSEGKDLKRIKVEASKLGADAIIITGATSFRHESGLWTAYSKEDGIKCIAIKFKEGEIVKPSSGITEKLEKEIGKNVEKNIEMLGLKLDLILEKLSDLKR